MKRLTAFLLIFTVTFGAIACPGFTSEVKADDIDKTTLTSFLNMFVEHLGGINYDESSKQSNEIMILTSFLILSKTETAEAIQSEALDKIALQYFGKKINNHQSQGTLLLVYKDGIYESTPISFFSGFIVKTIDSIEPVGNSKYRIKMDVYYSSYTPAEEYAHKYTAEATVLVNPSSQYGFNLLSYSQNQISNSVNNASPQDWRKVYEDKAREYFKSSNKGSIALHDIDLNSMPELILRDVSTPYSSIFTYSENKAICVGQIPNKLYDSFDGILTYGGLGIGKDGAAIDGGVEYYTDDLVNGGFIEYKTPFVLANEIGPKALGKSPEYYFRGKNVSKEEYDTVLQTYFSPSKEIKQYEFQMSELDKIINEQIYNPKYDSVKVYNPTSTVIQSPPAEEPATEAADRPVETPVVSFPSVRELRTSFVVDGRQLPFGGSNYNIGGNNYFGLRDIAKALSGTPKKFDVVYNDATKAINVISGIDYLTEGEIAPTSGEIKTATSTTSRIYVDGKELNLTVYLIDNRNYFKLRDVAEALDFAVAYDKATGTISINTSKSYEK